MTILEKAAIGGLTELTIQPKGSRKFYVGAAWDGDVDLDLAAVPLSGGVADSNNILYYAQLAALGGALKHSGDARNGDAEGDDESIIIDTDALPATVDAIVVGVIAYNVPDMSAAKNTRLRICDGADGSAAELYALPMSDDDVDGETLLVACALKRQGDGFVVKNIGEFHTEFPHGVEALKGLVAKAPAAAAA